MTNRRTRLAMAVGIPALCSAVVLSVVSLSGASPAYAATPTSSGPIDPAAIPLGDGYVSTTPRAGYVDACQTRFRAGAAHAGPWIDETTKTWNSTTKPTVRGSVSWPKASYSVTVQGDRRLVRFDDLPVGHTTGVFPISPSDPASAYDTNPNHIAAHATSWSLPLDPVAAKRPSCVPMGAIGVLSDGVYLYNALDASGRDAAAHEVQDACGAHPDGSDTYHHHDVPSCIVSKAPNGKATLVGYALDGYGIYVVKNAQGTMPTNENLDACHGTTSVVEWNGKPTRIYHYVATLEYPYVIGCFHGTPIHTGRTRAVRGNGAAGAASGTASGTAPGGGRGRPGCTGRSSSSAGSCPSSPGPARRRPGRLRAHPAAETMPMRPQR